MSVSVRVEALGGPDPANLQTTGVDLLELQQLGRAANGSLAASFDGVFNPAGLYGFGSDEPAGHYGRLTSEIAHGAPDPTGVGQHEVHISYRTTDGRTSLLSRGRDSDAFVLVQRAQPGGVGPDRFTLLYVRRLQDEHSPMALHTFARLDVGSSDDLVGLLDIESAFGLFDPDTTNPLAAQLVDRYGVYDYQEAVLDATTLSDSAMVFESPDVVRGRIDAGIAMSDEAQLMIESIGAQEPRRRHLVTEMVRRGVARVAAMAEMRPPELGLQG